MKRILSLICVLILAANLTVGFAVTEDEYQTIVSLVKTNAQKITHPHFSIDYTAKDAFDGLEIFEVADTEKYTVFRFDCKAKQNISPLKKIEDNIAEIFDVSYGPLGEWYVFDKLNNNVITLGKAYDSELISLDELRVLCKEFAYDHRQGKESPAVNDEKLEEVIKAQVNDLYYELYGFKKNDGTFADLYEVIYYDDENVQVFSFDSSTNKGMVGFGDWRLGDYYFRADSHRTLYVYDKNSDKLMLLDSAYKNGVVGDEILEQLSSDYFINNLAKPYLYFDEKIYEQKEALRKMLEERHQEELSKPIDPSSVELPDAEKTNIEGELFHKITLAIIYDGDRVFQSQYWDEENYWETRVKTINFVYAGTEFDGNYPVSFMYNDDCVDGWTDTVLGDYLIFYYSYGFGIYSTADNKLYSCEEAYEKGILTNERMYEIWQNQKGQKVTLNFITRVGDINKDGELDIVDVAKYRNAIVTGQTDEGYHSYSSIADMNHDGDTDIVDVAVLRRIIINGEH